MNRVRLYLGGITIIRLSSYVQDAEPFLHDLNRAAEYVISQLEMEENYVQQS